MRLLEMEDSEGSGRFMRRGFKSSTAIMAAIATGSMLALSVPVLAKPAPTNESWFSDVSWWTVNWNNKPGTVYNFITNKTGLTFTTDVPPEDADTKLNLMLATGTVPDIVTSQTYSEVDELVQSGKFWNMKDLFEKYDPSFLKQFPQGLVAQERINFGGFYAIPSYATTASEVNQHPQTRKEVLDEVNQAIVFNQYWMKKLGITLADVKTESGLLATLKKVAGMHLTYKGQPLIPLQVDPTGDWEGNSLNTVAAMFGAMPVTKQGNYRPLRLSPELKQAVNFFNTLYRDNVIDPSEFTDDVTSDNAAVTSGRVFAFLGNTGNPQWSSMYAQNHQWVWVSPGNILSSQGLRPTFGYSNYSGWTMTLVAKDAPDPAKVAKWLAYMWSPAGQRLALFGTPNNWHWVHGKVVENPNIVKEQNTDSTYWETSGIAAIWFFNTPVYLDTITPTTNLPPGSFETAMKEARATTPPVYDYNATPLNMPADLIAPNTPLYTTQEEINTYYDEQLGKMIFAPTAAQENAIYNQTIAKMKSLGLNQIDALYNKQFHKQEKIEHITVKGINP